jgi:hypothetical protein
LTPFSKFSVRSADYADYAGSIKAGICGTPPRLKYYRPVTNFSHVQVRLAGNYALLGVSFPDPRADRIHSLTWLAMHLQLVEALDLSSHKNYGFDLVARYS